MQFTNFTINRNTPLAKGQIQKTFSKEGININEEVRKEQFNIKDQNDRIVKQEEIQKAHVRAHSKTTKTGKVVNVKEHEDKRSNQHKVKTLFRRHGLENIMFKKEFGKWSYNGDRPHNKGEGFKTFKEAFTAATKR